MQGVIVNGLVLSFHSPVLPGNPVALASEGPAG